MFALREAKIWVTWGRAEESLINLTIYFLARKLLTGVMKKQLYCSLKKYWFQKLLLYSRHMEAALNQAVKSTGVTLKKKKKSWNRSWHMKKKEKVSEASINSEKRKFKTWVFCFLSHIPQGNRLVLCIYFYYSNFSAFFIFTSIFTEFFIYMAI